MTQDKEVQPPITVKQPGWPTFWPPSEYSEWLALMHKSSFQRGFQQKPQADEDLIFPHFREHANWDYNTDWKKISDPEEKEYFSQVSPYYVDPEWPRYTGVDLSGKKRRGTCIFTLAVSPVGVRHVLDVRLLEIDGPGTVREIQSVDDNMLLKPKRIFVENNAYQESFQDWIKESNVRCWVKVRPFRTGSNKMDLEIGLPAIDIQYDLNRWRIGIPHKQGRPVMPNKKDPTICICGPCMLVRAAQTFTRNDLDETPDTIAAQFIAKEASREGGTYTETSSGLIKVSLKEVQAVISTKRIPSQSLRIPVAMDGKKFLSERPMKTDYSRSSEGSKYPHPDPQIVHDLGTCAICDKFPMLQRIGQNGSTN